MSWPRLLLRDGELKKFPNEKFWKQLRGINVEKERYKDGKNRQCEKDGWTQDKNTHLACIKAKQFPCPSDPISKNQVHTITW